MNQLIIDRAKWRTGNFGRNRTGVGNTQLLNDDGYMCCLGFYCLQAGIPSENIMGVTQPDDILNVRKFYNKYEDMELLLVDREFADDSMLITDFTTIAMSINDDDNITSEKREDLLIHHFASVEVDVIFEGEYSEE